MNYDCLFLPCKYKTIFDKHKIPANNIPIEIENSTFSPGMIDSRPQFQFDRPPKTSMVCQVMSTSPI